MGEGPVPGPDRDAHILDCGGLQDLPEFALRARHGSSPETRGDSEADRWTTIETTVRRQDTGQESKEEEETAD